MKRLGAQLFLITVFVAKLSASGLQTDIVVSISDQKLAIVERG